MSGSKEGLIPQSYNCKSHPGIAGGLTREITGQSLSKFAFPFPPLPEQKQIADVLGGVDAAIEATRAVIDQTKRVKQGLLQTLLTQGIGHTKFKDSPLGKIPEGWEVKRLAALINSIDSGWSPQCEYEAAGESDWGIIKTTAVVWDGFNSAENKKLPLKLEPRPYIEISANDILITRAGPSERVGVVAHVDQVRPKLMLSDKIIRLRTKAELCLSNFMSIYLSASTAQKHLMGRKTGLAQSQTNISQQELLDTPFALPPLKEQHQIVSVLTAIQTTLNAETSKLKTLQELKKGLMQDLLTGRVRVPNAKKEAA